MLRLFLIWLLFLDVTIFFLIHGIILHECTHYFVAKLLRVKVREPQFYFCRGKPIGKVYLRNNISTFKKIIIRISAPILEYAYYFLLVFFFSFINNPYAFLLQIVFVVLFIMQLSFSIYSGDLRKVFKYINKTL